MAKPVTIELITEESMYVSERKIYPRDINGYFSKLRKTAVIVLLGLFYGVAWLNWDDRQAVLWDLPARKFYVFGLVFWPQDFFYLALLLIMAGLSLFFFTALAGRMWCGYACPQTVWTEVFIWMERLAEGNRSKQMKLDQGAWTREKILRKTFKHSIWLLFALWTGFTFVGYFTPIRDLAMRLIPFQWGGYEIFWTLFYSLATWGNAGFLREQVCKYMCPYARFQSAMFDRNTLIIAYDERRGEPRGARKKNAFKSVLERSRGLLDKTVADAYVIAAAHELSSADQHMAARATTALADKNLPFTELPKATGEALGDCIDCTICVQVCPTGIDIRNGLQYECIACGACVDACDEVMDKMGYPKGLVRYTSQNAVDGKKARVLRPRVLIYASLLGIIFVGFWFGILTRTPLIVDVLRDRNTLFRTNVDGAIENSYTLRIINKDEKAHTYDISLSQGPEQAKLIGQTDAVNARAGEVINVPITVQVPAGTVKGRQDIEFLVKSDQAGVESLETTRFFGPFQ